MPGRDPHRLRDVGQIVQPVEQRPELAGGGDPEQRAGRRIGVVVVGVRDAHRHPHQIPRPRLQPVLPELEIEDAFQHVDELVLLRMHVQRHEGPGRIEGLEAEAGGALGLQEVAVPEHVPGHPVLAFARAADAGEQAWRGHRDVLPEGAQSGRRRDARVADRARQSARWQSAIDRMPKCGAAPLEGRRPVGSAPRVGRRPQNSGRSEAPRQASGRSRPSTGWT